MTPLERKQRIAALNTEINRCELQKGAALSKIRDWNAAIGKMKAELSELESQQAAPVLAEQNQ